MASQVLRIDTSSDVTATLSFVLIVQLAPTCGLHNMGVERYIMIKSLIYSLQRVQSGQLYFLHFKIWLLNGVVKLSFFIGAPTLLYLGSLLNRVKFINLIKSALNRVATHLSSLGWMDPFKS